MCFRLNSRGAQIILTPTVGTCLFREARHSHGRRLRISYSIWFCKVPIKITRDLRVLGMEVPVLGSVPSFVQAGPKPGVPIGNNDLGLEKYKAGSRHGKDHRLRVNSSVT